jgi:hypothetical protein
MSLFAMQDSGVKKEFSIYLGCAIIENQRKQNDGKPKKPKRWDMDIYIYKRR